MLVFVASRGTSSSAGDSIDFAENVGDGKVASGG